MFASFSYQWQRLPLLTFGITPLIQTHVNLNRSNDKDSVLRSDIYHKKQRVLSGDFFSPVLKLVGVEITYEGVERNLGVKSGRNYAEIVVVNRYASSSESSGPIILNKSSSG